MNGIQEVRGSTPLGSTNIINDLKIYLLNRSQNWTAHRTLTGHQAKFLPRRILAARADFHSNTGRMRRTLGASGPSGLTPLQRYARILFWRPIEIDDVDLHPYLKREVRRGTGATCRRKEIESMMTSDDNSNNGRESVSLQEFELMAKRGHIHMAAEEVVKPSKSDLNKAQLFIHFGWLMNNVRIPLSSQASWRSHRHCLLRIHLRSEVCQLSPIETLVL